MVRGDALSHAELPPQHGAGHPEISNLAVVEGENHARECNRWVVRRGPPCRASLVAPASRTMKKLLGALLVVLVVLAAVALERTFTFRSRQPQVAAVAVEPLDTTALAQRLAGALRFKTISYQDSSQFDAREFDGFQRYLRATFPRLHAALKREQVNGYVLLYAWTGDDP